MMNERQAYRNNLPKTANHYTNSPDRIRVRSYVYLPNCEIDSNGFLCAENQPRGRTQAMSQEYTWLKKEDERMTKAYQRQVEDKHIKMPFYMGTTFIIAAIILLGALLLGKWGTLQYEQNELCSVNESIERSAKTIAALVRQVDEASDEMVICYTAAHELDMIPASAAAAIHLSAMDTRPLEYRFQDHQSSQALTQNTELLAEDEPGTMQTLASVRTN